MSEQLNRAAANLIPMCLEHAPEIDEYSLVDRYPVDILREWKQAQIDEYQSLQRSWDGLSDEDVTELTSASFDEFKTQATVAVTELARLVQRILDDADSTRGPVRAVAAAHAERHAQAQSRMSGIFTEDGEALAGQVQLSTQETADFQARFVAALTEAAADFEIHHNNLRAEVAAVRASAGSHSESRCDWIIEAAQDLAVEVAHWRADGDSALTTTKTQLQAAFDSLCAQLRNQPSEDPPVRTEPEPDPADAERAEYERVCALVEATLDRARPWARVEHRDYDDDLHRELLDIAPLIDTLPAALGRDLGVAAALAACVARNADTHQIKTVVDRICILEVDYVQLVMLSELADIVEHDTVAEALLAVRDRIRQATPGQVADSAFWKGRPHWLLGVVSEHDPQAAEACVDSALDSGMLCPILASLGSTDTGQTPPRLTIHPFITAPIAYINADRMRLAITQKYEGIEPRRPPWSYQLEDPCESLAAEYLFANPHTT